MRTRNLFKPDAAKPFKLSRSRIENFLNCPHLHFFRQIDRTMPRA